MDEVQRQQKWPNFRALKNNLESEQVRTHPWRMLGRQPAPASFMTNVELIPQEEGKGKGKGKGMKWEADRGRMMNRTVGVSNCSHSHAKGKFKSAKFVPTDSEDGTDAKGPSSAPPGSPPAAQASMTTPTTCTLTPLPSNPMTLPESTTSQLECEECVRGRITCQPQERGACLECHRCKCKCSIMLSNFCCAPSNKETSSHPISSTTLTTRKQTCSRSRPHQAAPSPVPNPPSQSPSQPLPKKRAHTKSKAFDDVEPEVPDAAQPKIKISAGSMSQPSRMGESSV